MGDKRFWGWRLPLRLACLVALCVSFGTGVAQAAAPPTCTDVAATANENAVVAIALQCTDVDGDALTYSAGPGPTNRSLSAIASDGTLSYTPNTGFVGTDTFQYDASSTNGQSGTQTVTITVVGPPSAMISSPADGGTYAQSATVPTSFACAEAAGGPGVTCDDSHGGSGTSGTLDTSSIGTQTYTVTATSQDGQTGTASINYAVADPPMAQISSPADGGTYIVGQSVPTTFTCADGTGGTGIANCTDSNGASSTNGSLDTSSVGAHTYTVTTMSDDGLNGSASIQYSVVNPPPVCQPVNATTAEGHAVSIALSCSDPNSSITGYSVAQPEDGSVSVPDPSGMVSYVPDAGFAGTDTFTYFGQSVDGESAPETVTVTVNAPAADAASPTGLKPEVSVTNPVNNAAYLWGSVPSAQFTCAAGTGGTLSSCAATVDGQSVVNGQALPSGIGTHAMNITATDADGMTSIVSVIYTVSSAINPPPPVSIGAPVQGASYRLGQSVRARYSCLASSHAPALKACVGSVAAGRAINTGTLGTHTFSVSATNAEGESSTETVTYRVVSTTNQFTAGQPRADAAGNIHLTLELPGPGAIAVVADGWNATGGARRRFAHHFVYALGSLVVHGAGRLPITIKPGAKGRALVRLAAGTPVIALRVAYEPTGGRPREQHLREVRIRRRGR